jgi:hypothetical protein
MRFHIYSIQGTFVLISPQVPHWRCTGFSPEEVIRDCACSLRSYVRNIKSITPNEATSIAEALTLRTASQFDEPPVKWV